MVTIFKEEGVAVMNHRAALRAARVGRMVPEGFRAGERKSVSSEPDVLFAGEDGSDVAVNGWRRVAAAGGGPHHGT